MLGEVVGDGSGQLQSLLLGLRLEDVDHLIKAILEKKWRGHYLQSPGINLGYVNVIIDDVEKVSGGIVYLGWTETTSIRAPAATMPIRIHCILFNISG